jgi:hypothetical protein
MLTASHIPDFGIVKVFHEIEIRVSWEI